MRTITMCTFIAAAMSAVTQTFAAPDPNFHIYLAFGQSNMEGQGNIEGQDRTVDKRFQMISTFSGCNHQVGQWYDAVPPLANCEGKLGPVDYFGRTLVKKLPKEIKVGVAVVAIAGCDIQLFEKYNYRNYQIPSWMESTFNAYGRNPYGRLIEMGKKAKEVGVIKGILLHQGETNTGQQNWPQRVKAIYEDILKDLGLKAEEVPLLAGEVVQSSAGGQCGSMNSIIQKLPQTIKTAHVISSQGLGQQGDGLHFTSAAYRTFGERYATEMLKILGDVKPVDPNQGKEEDKKCWSEPLGYPCCKGKTEVLDTDENGQWGVENDEWCGIVRDNKESCWATKLGYKCCSTDACRNVLYSDDDGQWDYVDDDWCGITSANKLC